MSYSPVQMMKQYISFCWFTVFIISACHNPSVPAEASEDSVQYLLRTIRDSIQKYPEDPRPKYNLAIVLQDAGRYREAVKALDSIRFTPEDSVDHRLYYDYLFKRAELLELAGDTAEAIRTLELFVRPGELTQAGLRLTHLYAETNNPKALYFSEAMKKNDATGNDPQPDYLQGIFYYNSGDYKNALIHFDECIRKDYTFLEAYIEKGSILYKQKRLEEALRVFDLALNISHSYADAYYWKAKCQEATGQLSDARLNYLRAYGLDTTLKEAREAANRMKK